MFTRLCWSVQNSIAIGLSSMLDVYSRLPEATQIQPRHCNKTLQHAATVKWRMALHITGLVLSISKGNVQCARGHHDVAIHGNEFEVCRRLL